MRGYHTSAGSDDSLACQEEQANVHDEFAVTITHNNLIVGHVPRNLARGSIDFIIATPHLDAPSKEDG